MHLTANMRLTAMCAQQPDFTAFCVVYVVILFTVVAVIIIGIIWFCKKYHVSYSSDTNLQSGTVVVTDASAKAVELQDNPSYVATHRKEVHIDNSTRDDYEEVDIADNPSYTPFLKSEDDAIPPLPSRKELANPLYNAPERDAQNTEEYDYL